MSERLVVTVASKPKRKNPGSRVRFCTPDGKWHTYLNEAVPEGGPLIQSLCDRCGHGYGENIINGTCKCSECRTEDAMERAEALQAQGIDVGAHTADKQQQRMAYGYREPVSATLRW